MWQRFDKIQLLTTRNIKFLSGPSGRPATPDGNWSIIGNLPGGMLLAAKDETIIAVPLTDVKKVAEYSIDKVLKNIRRVKSMSDLKKESSSG